MKNRISRRDFLKGSLAGAATAALSAGGLGVIAGAAETENMPSEAAENELYTYADTIKWDAEYDVAVLGMGFAGMNAAIAASDAGASTVIIEKMPEEQAGGNSKVCGQMFAYGHGDYEATLAYYKAMTGGRQVPEAMLETIVKGITTTWEDIRDLVYGGDDSEFYDLSDPEIWGILAKMSPEYPEYEGHEKVALCSTHAGVSDSFLFQNVKALIADRADKIDVWYATPALELIQDPDTKVILGVKVNRDGTEMNVRALNGVVVATGGFEDNKEMVQQYLNVINYAPLGGLYNTGDGIRMCQKVGANLWHMAAYEGGFGLGGATYDVEDGMNAIMISTLTQNSMNTGASILVGDEGERFMNESETPRHGHVYANGIWENPQYPRKIWWIFDQTQWDAIEEEGAFREDYKNTIQEADTIEDAAAIIGCPAVKLKKTIASYNAFAESGIDFKADREAEYMRAFDGQKYYVVPMKSCLLNTQGGPERNEKAEILDVTGEPIPHLYSAGEMGGITAFMYQGGTNVAECFIFGKIAGTNAAAPKDDAGVYAVRDAVESTPAKPGEVTDLGAAAETDVETAGNEYVGSGLGMDGNVTVKVTVDDGGVITGVEVVEASETPGIGTVAIEQMPEKFVGLSTAEEIDALDSISGASVTSQALRDAVKAALAQIG